MVASDDSLVELTFGAKAEVPTATVSGNAHPILRETQRQLDEYFAGTRQMFDLPLAPPDQPFSRLAWEALLNIPYGQTRSYGQQAIAIGRPTAVRAVARANGANRIAIVIPCHRVIGSNGSLTGFGGGLPIKRWLLDHEAVVAGRSQSLFAVG